MKRYAVALVFALSLGPVSQLFAGTFNGGSGSGPKDGSGGGHWMDGKPYADDRMVSNLVWQGRNSGHPETEAVANEILHDLLIEIRADQLAND